MSTRFVLSHLSSLLTAAVLLILGLVILPNAFYTDSREDQVQIQGRVSYLYVSPKQNPADTVFTFRIKEQEKTFSVTGLSFGDAALLSNEKLGTEFSLSVERTRYEDAAQSEVPVLSLSSRKNVYLEGGGIAARFAKLRKIAGIFALACLGGAVLLFRRLRAIGETEKFDPLAIRLAAWLSALGWKSGWASEALTRAAEREEKLARRGEVPKSRHAKAVHLLLAKGRVDAQNAAGQTALHLAAAAGHVEAVDMLLRSGASVDIQDSEGNTALLIAAQGRSMGVVSRLLQNGASVLIKNKAGQQALEAVDAGKKDRVISEMIKRATEKQNALNEAIEKKDADALAAAARGGAQVNMPNESGVKPIAAGILSGMPELVQKLLQLGAAVGEEELAAAAATGRREIIAPVRAAYEKVLEKEKREAALKERAKAA